MRRFPAIVLVAIFGFSVIGPALVVDRGTNLPACCRRDGKHRCASIETSDAGLRVTSPRCAEFPKSGAFPLHSETALPGGSQLIFGALLQYPAVAAQAAAGYRISFSRSRQKRGPPSLFS
jgi:hypothetical protein